MKNEKKDMVEQAMTTNNTQNYQPTYSIEETLQSLGFVKSYSLWRLIYMEKDVYCYWDGKYWMLRVNENVLPFATSSELQQILHQIQVTIQNNTLKQLHKLEYTLFANLLKLN
jgi:hypothetical protein